MDSAARAREQAREILGQGRFHDTKVPRPFKGLLRWIGDRIDDVGRAVAGLPGPPWIAWLVLALVVIGVAVWLARGAIRRRAVSAVARRARETVPEVDPAELERAADAAERDGDFEAAVRLRFRAGVLRLERGRRLEPGGLRTTGEIGAVLHSPEFDTLGEDFDAIAYGGRAAGERDARAARDGWKAVAP